ncbi:Copia protein, partial [Mucuna pruriens]
MKHLKVFVSLCFKHVPYKRKKLDDKGERMTLVGYHTVWSYKLYNPINQNMTINRDVFIDEKRLDFSEVFAPIARLEIMRLAVAFVNFNEKRLFQLDVKVTFLNGPLEKEVYVSQLPRFEVKVGCSKCFVEYGIYVKDKIDVDMIFGIGDQGEIKGSKGKMKSKFDMTNLGES